MFTWLQAHHAGFSLTPLWSFCLCWFRLVSLTSLHGGFPASILNCPIFSVTLTPHTFGDVIQSLGFKYHLHMDHSQIYISCMDHPVASWQAQPRRLRLDKYLKPVTFKTKVLPLPQADSSGVFPISLNAKSCLPVTQVSNSGLSLTSFSPMSYIQSSSKLPCLCLQNSQSQNFSPLGLYLLGHSTIVSCLDYGYNFPSWSPVRAQQSSQEVTLNISQKLLSFAQSSSKASFRTEALMVTCRPNMIWPSLSL